MQVLRNIVASLACSLLAWLLVAWIVTLIFVPKKLHDPDLHFWFAMQAVTSMARGSVAGTVAAIIVFVFAFRFFRRGSRRSS